MKKIFLVLAIILLVTGCNLMGKKGKLEEITFEQYEEKIKNNESFTLFIWMTGCAHCEALEPILKEVIDEKGLTVYSINISNISETEYEKLKNKTFLSGTPTTVIFEKGKKKDKIVGDGSTKEDLIKFFKKNGYIGE